MRNGVDLEQQVTVISLDGDVASVRGQRATACGGCAGKASCSTLGSWTERFSELQVKNTVRAEIGDMVELEVPDALLLKVAFRLYGLPMISFIVVGALFSSLAQWMQWPMHEPLAAVAAIAAVVATYLLQLKRSKDQKVLLDVRMTRIIYKAEMVMPLCAR